MDCLMTRCKNYDEKTLWSCKKHTDEMLECKDYLTTQKDLADVPLECRVMCAACKKECLQEDLHEVTGTTTLSNHTMTFEICDDCDPRNVENEKNT